MAAIHFIVLFCGSIFHHCLSYPSFLDDIPNARTVPDPCDVRLGVERDKWRRVGHLPPSLEYRDPNTRKLTKNPFGADFIKHGRKFTKELCNMDSDGDGKMNWEELGFKSGYFCTFANYTQFWNAFAKKKAPAHPGLCEYHREKCIQEELKAINFCMTPAKFDLRETKLRFQVWPERDRRNNQTLS
ncbi:hypothetical protein FSP39_021757 [Pinctada imbricata]|uniref:Temptin Cys/Cys disulfide domain-containing protein n=1 Tax=Pinctada imbricata TaxID=66713 RepID=A0AA88YJN8_PINIB|nr:hypothetical protein FSP39_021757 [Pinctada imbricata]